MHSTWLSILGLPVQCRDPSQVVKWKQRTPKPLEQNTAFPTPCGHSYNECIGIRIFYFTHFLKIGYCQVSWTVQYFSGTGGSDSHRIFFFLNSHLRKKSVLNGMSVWCFSRNTDFSAMDFVVKTQMQ